MWTFRTHLVNSLIFHLLLSSFASGWIHKPHQNNYPSKWRKIYDDFFFFKLLLISMQYVVVSCVNGPMSSTCFYIFTTEFVLHMVNILMITNVVRLLCPNISIHIPANLCNGFVLKFEVNFIFIYFVLDACLRLNVDFYARWTHVGGLNDRQIQP